MKNILILMLIILFGTNINQANSTQSEPPKITEDGYEILTPHEKKYNFQEPASPIMEEIYEFHTILLYIIFGVSIFVILLIFYTCIRFRASKNPNPSKTSHNTLIEIVWTAIPIIILAFISVKSIPLLYKEDKIKNPDMTIKVTGYQWYWGYEYPDLTIGEGEDAEPINFLSNMVKDEDIRNEDYKPAKDWIIKTPTAHRYRLLETDNRVVVPVDTNVKLLITGADVIHAWAIPSFGVKMDAIPGFTNETWFRATKTGVFYGQCSELCGKDHGFMPIAVEVVTKEDFAKWASEKTGKNITEKDFTNPKNLAKNPAKNEANLNNELQNNEPANKKLANN